MVDTGCGLVSSEIALEAEVSYGLCNGVAARMGMGFTRRRWTTALGVITAPVSGPETMLSGITTVMLCLARPDLEQLERLHREVVPLLE